MNRPTQAQLDAAHQAIVDFSWGNYGLDEVEALIEDHPENQDWLPVLACAVATAAVNA